MTTFAERSWHTCSSCRLCENKGSNGCPPWPICLVNVSLPNETKQGRTCNRYSALPWARNPNAG